MELFLTAMLVGAIGIFSPTRLALSVLMLTSATAPWRRAFAYAIGSTAVFALAAIDRVEEGIVGAIIVAAVGAVVLIQGLLG